MNNLAIIITARKGSKGLPGKNLKILNGKPLIDYSILTALKLKNIKVIALTSDSEQILERGIHYGVDTILRPKTLAQDNSLVIDAIIHAVDELNYKHSYNIDSVLLLQPTFPLRDIKELDESLNIFHKNPKYSVVSVEKMKEHPCECIELKSSSKDSWSYLRDPKSVTNRQEYNGEYYFINGNFYISTFEFIKLHKSFISESTNFYICKEANSIDIDTLSDFYYAEYLMSKK
tara:strand:- start:2016 stop:2711 length:696 start_codon:yes stop_codon:yes gene_type:complete